MEGEMKNMKDVCLYLILILVLVFFFLIGYELRECDLVRWRIRNKYIERVGLVFFFLFVLPRV